MTAFFLRDGRIDIRTIHERYGIGRSGNISDDISVYIERIGGSLQGNRQVVYAIEIVVYQSNSVVVCVVVRAGPFIERAGLGGDCCAVCRYGKNASSFVFVGFDIDINTIDRYASQIAQIQDRYVAIPHGAFLV